MSPLRGLLPMDGGLFMVTPQASRFSEAVCQGFINLNFSEVLFFYVNVMALSVRRLIGY